MDINLDGDTIYDELTGETIKTLDEATLDELARLAKIEYDSNGRMKYNPIFHCNNGEMFSNEDINYLISWYEEIGVEEISFALNRTIAAIQLQVSKLRKLGLMEKVENPKKHKRIKRKI